MNHEMAAELRTTLNDKHYVEGPDEDSTGDQFWLVRVRQPGYLNAEPMYEVLVDVHASDSDRLHLPYDFLELVTDHDCYLRIDDGTIHIRDWKTDGVDDE